MRITQEARIARWKALFILLFLSTIAVFMLNVMLGSVSVHPRDILRVVLDRPGVSPNHHSIISKIRLPRALATVAGGASLAVAGLLLQIFFANPIVEPYVLGVSSGSMMFVALVMLGGYTFGFRTTSPMFLFWGALCGALLVMIAVVFAANRVKNIVTLLVIGIMAGYLCSAVTTVLTTLASREAIANYTLWTMGSFSGFTWQKVRILVVITSIFSVLAILMSKPLNAMLLGEQYAQSMGVGIRSFRVMVVIIASVLAAVLTAFAGPVSFVGMAVPHIVRITFGTSDNRVLLPASIMAGAILTGLCDLGARLLLAPIELPLAAITSAFGAPLVVYLLTRKENSL